MNLSIFFQNNPIIFYIYVGIFSLITGSFLNVVIYRLPLIIMRNYENECKEFLSLPNNIHTPSITLAKPNSHCPHCKKHIKPWHNIPIISYLFLRGRCAHCKSLISWRYPFVEFLTTIFSVLTAFHFGAQISLIPALIFTWMAICLTFIDIDHQILPDELTLTLVWLGLFISLFHLFTSPESAIIGGIVGYGVLAVIQYGFGLVTGKIGMGQGDFKLLAGLGTFFGWQCLPSIALFASLSGLIFAFTYMLYTKNFKSVPLPFGPYLALGGWLVMIFGPDFFRVYFF